MRNYAADADYAEFPNPSNGVSMRLGRVEGNVFCCRCRFLGTAATGGEAEKELLRHFREAHHLSLIHRTERGYATGKFTYFGRDQGWAGEIPDFVFDR
jgi:hypothetical protein